MFPKRARNRHSLRLIAIIALVIAPTILAATPASAESRWSAHDPQNTQSPDYSPLNVFLGGYTDKKGSRTTLAYQAMGQRGAKFLDDYVSYLQSIPVSKLNRDQQLAYWLNLHNVAALRETLAAYPARRVESLVTGTGSAWERKSLVVEGVPLSLAEIQTDILLTEWNNPRVIYGIFLPAKAAPAISTKAFTEKTVYASLEDAAAKYINGKDAVPRTGKTPTVSWIYQRFSAAFDSNDTKVIEHLQKYAKSRLAKRIADANAISGYDFDWAINEHKPRQPSRSIGSSGGFSGSRGGGFGS